MERGNHRLLNLLQKTVDEFSPLSSKQTKLVLQINQIGLGRIDVASSFNIIFRKVFSDLASDHSIIIVDRFLFIHRNN